MSGFRAIYLHVPYCVRKCAYCDFLSSPCPHGSPELAAYAQTLKDKLRLCAEAGLLDGCETAYIGGGTPTLLSEGLVDIVSYLRIYAPELGELSCEANPESLTAELARSLADAGATRVSIGVQSTDAAELEALGRIHSAEEALAAIRSASVAGLRTSADLMCAIPLQTRASFERSISEVLDAGATHVSVYPLQIEEDTRFFELYGDEDPAWNSGDAQAQMMELAEKLLVARGLSRYEVASYAIPGQQCAHNIAYWTGVPYLGLGPGAASMCNGALYRRLRELFSDLPDLPEGAVRARIAMSAEGASAEVEFLEGREAAAEDMMLGFRMSEGPSIDTLVRAKEQLGHDRVERMLASCREDGLIDGDNRPTARGWLLGNELFGRAWDLAN